MNFDFYTIQANHTNASNDPITWIEIDAEQFAQNIANLQVLNPLKKISIVVKANAYGHGIVEIAKLCQENRHVEMICTFSLKEALSLRQHGITKNILVLGALDESLEKALTENISLTVLNVHMAQRLNQLAKHCNVIAKIHIKIDTGLSRLGFLHATAFEDVLEINRLKHIKLDGIYSHFSEADLEDATFTQLQKNRLEKLINELEEVHINFTYKHIENTSAYVKFSQDKEFFNAFNMARIGGGSFGLLKPYIQKISADFLHVSPIFQWKSRLLQIRTVPAESFISYARTHQVQRDTIIGIVPIGYSDGFDRRFSNNSFVLIKNKKAPVIGRICMNAFIIDLTHIDAQLDDEVLLLGNHAELTADNLAAKLETINYELLTRINKDIIKIVK